MNVNDFEQIKQYTEDLISERKNYIDKYEELSQKYDNNIKNHEKITELTKSIKEEKNCKMIENNDLN